MFNETCANEQNNPNSMPVEIVWEQEPTANLTGTAIVTQLAEALKQAGNSLDRVKSISVRTRMVPEIEITATLRDED